MTGGRGVAKFVNQLKVALGGGARMTSENHMKDFTKYKVAHLIMSTAARSMHLIYSIDRKLGHKEGGRATKPSCCSRTPILQEILTDHTGNPPEIH